MTAYEVFCLYHSLKLHFTQQSYDYFRYQGKSKVTIDSFEVRKDKWHFSKLSRKFTNKEECVSFLVANFLEDEKVWIGSLLTEEADIIFKKRQKVIQSLSYTFENDCLKLFEHNENPNGLLKVTNGEHPVLLKKTMRKEIEIETACILNMILNFLPNWQTKISDTIIWPIWQTKILKYAPFLPQDTVKYKLLLKKVLND
jgi:hypothetical protein